MRTIRNTSKRYITFPSHISIAPGQHASIPEAFVQRADVQALIAAGELQDVTPGGAG
ncbi:hypothetical protein [Teichococcus vastitatis]|uniref:hypothetical protein n=1 Tax=Teichococcus vastitatis TaxID=2307076 RepID=UPI0013007D40|nr:hypothetical protein [Pseudoroseomonas vastitatis]